MLENFLEQGTFYRDALHGLIDDFKTGRFTVTENGWDVFHSSKEKSSVSSVSGDHNATPHIIKYSGNIVKSPEWTASSTLAKKLDREASSTMRPESNEPSC